LSEEIDEEDDSIMAEDDNLANFERSKIEPSIKRQFIKIRNWSLLLGCSNVLNELYGIYNSTNNNEVKMYVSLLFHDELMFAISKATTMFLLQNNQKSNRHHQRIF
jgi:hypothetical protein